MWVAIATGHRSTSPKRIREHDNRKPRATPARGLLLSMSSIKSFEALLSGSALRIPADQESACVSSAWLRQNLCRPHTIYKPFLEFAPGEENRQASALAICE
jgi:hypothetical protein